MLVNFNLEQLDELLLQFYRLTGMTISVWDADFRQLSFQPKEMTTFCRMIKSTEAGSYRCFLSDKKLCTESALSGKQTTHYCHAGLLDTAVPIKFKETIIGYMMFGQVSDKMDETVQKRLEKLCKEIKVDYDQLLDAYSVLDTYDKDKIKSAAFILKMATRYLWLSEYIEIGYNTTASQIDDYIHSHLKENISVQSLCEVFQISKNRLYELSHRWFEMPIGDYITTLRINEAKRLLTSTDLPISRIGPLVGIRDYNYFTKFFKTCTGLPPLRYRKTFPFQQQQSVQEEPQGQEQAKNGNG